MKYDKTMLLTAMLWSTESYCDRAKVGCVIAKDSRIIACGYNGTLTGSDNCCEENDKTKETVVHAEMNTILFAAKAGISTKDCTMFVTLAPCIQCSKSIIQSGISRVVYQDDYSTEGIELLRENGVEVEKFIF